MHQVDKWFRFLNLTQIVEGFTSKKTWTKSFKPICLLKQLYCERILQPANQHETDGPPLPIVAWDFLKPILRSVVKKVANLDSIHYNLGMDPSEDAGDHRQIMNHV